MIHRLLVIRSLLFLIVFAIFSAPASAQTGVQISYTRPAKGAAFQVFNAITGSTTSAVYDFSAFESVILYGTCAANCQVGTIVTTTGSSTATGTFSNIADPKNICFGSNASTSFSCTLSNLPPFIKFTGSPVGTLTLVVVPIPFAIRKEVSGSVANAGSIGSNTISPVIVGGTNSGATTAYSLVVDTAGGATVIGEGTAGTPAGGVLSVNVVGNANGNTSTKETLACPSPCAVTAANTVFANANASRHQCNFQNYGTVPIYICLHATTCNSTTFDRILGNPGGAAGAAAMSTSNSIGPQVVVWSGGITMSGAAGGLVAGDCY